jgi:parallel beta-helix repeat protein
MNRSRAAASYPARRHATSLTALIAGAWLVLALVPSPARAVVVKCGDTLTQDTVVSNNLTCPDDFTPAINIGADGIVVDLAGHTVSAPQPSIHGKIGIAFNGHDHVTLRNGYVRNFQLTGVLVDGDDNLVERVRTMNNNIGLWLFDARRNRVTANLQDGDGVGIAVNGFSSAAFPPPPEDGHNSISYDRATGNDVGIEFLNSGRSNTVTRSTLSDNGTGILAFAEVGDVFSYNTLTSNDAGLVLAEGQDTVITANAASGNEIGFSFADCPDPPSYACTAGTVVRNNRAVRNTYGYDAGLFFNGTFTGNRAQLSTAVGFRLRGTVGVKLVDNIAGSVSGQSGRTDGNGIGIAVGSEEGRGFISESFGTVLQGNSAHSNKGGPDGPGHGILISGSGDTVLTGNTTNRNAADGIHLTFSFGNSRATLTSNTAWYNGGFGISALGVITDGGGNRAFGNVLGQCIGVACP